MSKGGGVVEAHNAKGWSVCLGCGKATAAEYELFCAGCADGHVVKPAHAYPLPDISVVRTFASGANRDGDEGKLDIEGFVNPLVIQRFSEFMHANRRLKDGTLRDSDNFQRGIPRSAYRKSLMRHVLDVWLHGRGYVGKAIEDEQTALCAVIFNAQGLLLELLLGRDV